jgi:hypothetical protein
MRSSVRKITQLIPCEPGWRNLYAYRDTWENSPTQGQVVLREEPIIGWAIILENENSEQDPRSDVTAIHPVEAPSRDEGYVLDTDISEGHALLLLRPGDKATDFQKDIDDQIAGDDRRDAAKKAS